MPLLLSLLVGVGLSAAAGFRVFVPLLVVGIAQRTGHAALAADFAWLGSNVALALLAPVLVVAALGLFAWLAVRLLRRWRERRRAQPSPPIIS